jgi:hypothetical protein
MYYLLIPSASGEAPWPSPSNLLLLCSSRVWRKSNVLVYWSTELIFIAWV